VIVRVACGRASAATEGVFANGIELDTVVDTPGNGIEPGLSFSVDASGDVTP